MATDHACGFSLWCTCLSVGSLVIPKVHHLPSPLISFVELCLYYWCRRRSLPSNTAVGLRVQASHYPPVYHIYHFTHVIGLWWSQRLVDFIKCIFIENHKGYLLIKTWKQKILTCFKQMFKLYFSTASLSVRNSSICPMVYTLRTNLLEKICLKFIGGKNWNQTELMIISPFDYCIWLATGAAD